MSTPTSVQEFDALGTHWWIAYLSDTPNLQAVKDAVMQCATEFGAAYSRFSESSQLSKLNDSKVLQNPGDEIRGMVLYALDMYKRTNKLFNISVGATLENKGYGKEVDAEAHLSDNLTADVTVSEQAIKIAPHVRLDFGGFGKGWLIDKIAVLLEENGIKYYVINGGGDIKVRSDEAVELALEHPTDASMMIGTVAVKSGALAVSSPIKRTWQVNGVTQTHIVNTADPTQELDVLSSFVRADTALLADTLSTLLLFASKDVRERIVNAFAIEYLLVLQDYSVVATPNFSAHLN